MTKPTNDRRREREMGGLEVSFRLIRKMGIIGSGPAPGRLNHQMSKTAEYRAWSSAQSRCSNPNCRSYDDYGGRGITFAKEWLGGAGFQRFLEHIGARPTTGHSLDRIDVNGNYEPGNVRWATRTEQARNKRISRQASHDEEIVAFGIRKTVREWITEFGCDEQLMLRAFANRRSR